MTRLVFVATILATLMGGQSFAQSEVALRYGDHAGFGRVVFDVARGADLPVAREDDAIIVSIGAPAKLPSAGPPRNVRGVSDTGGQVRIELMAKVAMRRLIVNDHLVIDLLDPPASSPQASPPLRTSAVKVAPTALAPASPAQSPDRTPTTHPTLSPLPSAAPSQPTIERADTPAPAPPSAAPTPQPLVVPEAALAVEARSAPDQRPGHLLSVPFSAQVGAAAFRRGPDAVVVFDEPRPIDLQRLKDDSVFGAATVQLLPAATVIRIPLPRPAELRLARHDGAWVVTAIGGDVVPAALQPIAPEQAASSVLLAARQPGLVISVPDPATGGVLLVGTQREAGQAVAVARHTPDFTLIPTWQGVAVDLVSDGVGLRAQATGFALAADMPDVLLASSAPTRDTAAASEASRMSRLFDFPDLPTEGLVRRMQGAVLNASVAPAQGRAPARQAVAEAMLALGLGAEAQAVLGLAATGDARTEADAAMQGLTGIAAVLCGRLDEAGGLDDPRLDGLDEIAFWRAIRTALRTDGSPDAAATFANTAPLLDVYPAALQARLAPIVAETMTQGGQPAAAQRLADRHKDDSALDLARALLLQAKHGEPTAVLSQLDRLSGSSDRMVRLRAVRTAAELRLAQGLASPAQTAETLGRMMFAWRGDEREVELRLRVAELLATSGQWRPALKLLRETESGWPERQAAIHARLTSVFVQSLSPDAQAQLTPFDLVALAGENADLMPKDDAGQALAGRVTEQLLRLDLPDRAIPFLEKIIAASPAGITRAAFGERLAALRLQQGNPAGAIEALTVSATDRLPSALLESRTLVFASSVAAQGDLASAGNALRQLDTEAGDSLLADLAEAAHRWPDAQDALGRYAARVVPETGPVDERQGRVLLRLASAASEAGDDAALARLRLHDSSRFAPGKTGDLFRLLTSQPVHSVADLPRGARDVAAARAGLSVGPTLAAR